MWDSKEKYLARPVIIYGCNPYKTKKCTSVFKISSFDNKFHVNKDQRYMYMHVLSSQTC